MKSDGDFIVLKATNRTITVTDPNGQLLIDTNYDGQYETGVKEFSSFEICFRLNSTTPLSPGTGTFKFQSCLTLYIYPCKIYQRPMQTEPLFHPITSKQLTPMGMNTEFY
jgi:hypothetical protein